MACPSQLQRALVGVVEGAARRRCCCCCCRACLSTLDRQSRRAPALAANQHRLGGRAFPGVRSRMSVFTSTRRRHSQPSIGVLLVVVHGWLRPIYYIERYSTSTLRSSRVPRPRLAYATSHAPPTAPANAPLALHAPSSTRGGVHRPHRPHRRITGSSRDRKARHGHGAERPRGERAEHRAIGRAVTSPLARQTLTIADPSAVWQPPRHRFAVDLLRLTPSAM